MTYRATRELMADKLKTVAEIVSIAAQARQRGAKIVFTNGCFDVLHRGHLHVLRQAKAAGDLLVVALNSDRSVAAVKGPGRPVTDQASRVELIAAMEMVDYVVVFDEADPYKLIEAIQPDVLAKGGDWKMDEVVGADILERRGGRVVLVPYLEGFSTTQIIERMRS